MNKQNKIIRSRLIIPINVTKFVERANTRNADVIVLDLEDSVPNERKEHARRLIPNALNLLSTGGPPVYIRVNSDSSLLYKDIEQSVRDGVNGIILPKVETGGDIETISQWITALEEKYSLPHGQFNISVLIETAKGFLEMDDILKASDRIDTISLGMEDLAADMGFMINEQTSLALNYLRMKLITVAKANHVLPLGTMGSITNYTELDKYRKHAREAFELGFVGSSCIHPSQVKILNDSFHFNAEEIKEAEEIVTTFNDALNKDRASASYKGRMIDYPHYEKYKNIMDRDEQVVKYERMKKIEERR